ncbi:type IV secretory system conjugative DNA transfer family protein [Arcobacter sp. F2176]|uniref:type IV secretory system conjugative DNA transfer family protein n=1 Tax=Arcobacter sp. F2176 TaxID=2044511 RepID=UPI00100A38F7|nr:type IV secretory system conjugative DNA transfer family protein [Arcobacter sp. F2176]RXJ82168.1 hypothetical protein CRU95_04585 [Arcobacter sp. F2176]
MKHYNIKFAFIKFFLLLLIVSPFIYSLVLNHVYHLQLLDLSIWQHINSIEHALKKETAPLYTLGVYVALLTPLTGFLPRLGVRGEYGSAAFADDTLIKKMKLFEKKGIVLGKKGSKLLRYSDPLSCLVLAPPNTGKSSSISVPNLLLLEASTFAFDIKGELFEITSKYRKEKYNSKIYKFNPLDKDCVKFNPLDKSIIGDIFDENHNLIIEKWAIVEEIVNEVAYLIYPEKENYDYWSEEGRNIFILLALWLIYKNGSTSIPEIRSFSMQDFISLYPEYPYEDNTDPLIFFLYIEIQKEENDDFFSCSLPSRIKEEVIAIKKKADKEYSGVYGSFKSPLNIFSNPIIAENFSSNELVIEDFRKEISSLYISIKEKDLKPLTMVNRLFIEFNLRRLLSVLPGKDDLDIVGIYDEFPRFGKLDYLMEVPSLGRGYKKLSIFIAQDYAQIKKIYGQETLDILESTTAYKVIFPQNNKETAKRYAEIIGDFTVERRSESRSLDTKGSRSIQKQLLGQKLITEQDLLSLDKDTIYILATNNYKNPIKAKPYRYFEDKKLLKELDHANKI